MEPTTLIEAVQYFKDLANCKAFLVPRRWANGVVTCPRCGSTAVTDQPKYNRWQCSVHHDRRQFTLKTGTIFEDSPLGLDKWLPAMWLICSNRNGISSWELHRALGVTQKTAWFMLARIRLAMQDENNGGKLSGEVECDETFIGGKARNMHKASGPNRSARNVARTAKKSCSVWLSAAARFVPFTSRSGASRYFSATSVSTLRPNPHCSRTP
jgi:transposase-like protein